MSKFGMLTGLIISVVIHLIFMWSPKFSSQSQAKQELVKVMDMAMAEVMTVPESPAEEAPPPEEQPPPPEEPEESPPPPPPAEEEPPPPPPPPAEETPPPQPPAPDEAPIEDLHEEVKSSQPLANQGGDLGPSDPEAPKPVGLSIDWGTTQDAVRVIQAGRMKLAILDETGSPPYRQVVYRGGKWEMQPITWELGMTYSDRVRIVHRHPAFVDAARSLRLRPGESLAVYVPLNIDRQIESSQVSAASAHGLSLSEVYRFVGKFRVNRHGVTFYVTGIERRG